MPHDPLTGVMAKLARVSPVTEGVTAPEPAFGPTDAGLFEQVSVPV